MVKSQINVRAYTVQVLRDGNKVGVCIGTTLVNGVTGFGDDVPSALEDLAQHLRAKPDAEEAPEQSKLRDELSHPFHGRKRKGKLLQFRERS